MTDHSCSFKIHASAGGVRPEEPMLLDLCLFQTLAIPRAQDLAQCYLYLVSRNDGYVMSTRQIVWLRMYMSCYKKKD